MRYHDPVASDERETSAEARTARARARSSWSGQVGRLGELPEVEVLDLPPAILFGLVRQLTLEAWALGGAAMPSYPRSSIPGRVLRPGGR